MQIFENQLKEEQIKSADTIDDHHKIATSCCTKRGGSDKLYFTEDLELSDVKPNNLKQNINYISNQTI